jgi:tetratricopeptide (TPR) repeat protein
VSRRFVAGILLSAGILCAVAGAADPDEELARLRASERGTHAPSPQDYAKALSDIGRDYLQRGDSARAIELLSEAVARDPENGVALANLTLAYLRNGDLEFAQFYLDLARHTEGRENPDPRFYVALGEIYDAQNRSEDAVTAWEQALRLGSRDPQIRRRLDRAQKDWARAHGQRYLSGDHFEYFFDPSIGDAEVARVDAFLESAAGLFTGFFFAASPPHVTVILYAGREYFHVLETPDWVGGFYDGKIRVPLESGHADDERFLGLLRHELAHAFLDRISHGRAPAWLQEGLAQYVEGRRVDSAELRTLRTPPGRSLLEDAASGFRQRTDRDQARTAYLLSLSYVQQLVRIGGTGAAVCLASDLGRGFSLEESFGRQFGEAPDVLEAAWRKAILAAPQ